LRTKFLVSVGGLGNQLFICSFAHRLIEEGASKVVIFNNWHRNHPNRKCELQLLLRHCTHEIELASRPKMYFIHRILSKLTLKFNRHISSRILSTYLEGENNDSRSVNSYTFYSGYFQNIKYFPTAESFLEELSRATEEVRVRLNKRNQLPTMYQGVHVRRGDYIEHNSTFGMLAVDYFVKNTTPEIENVIVSDDGELDFASYLGNKKLFYKLDQNLSAWEILSILSFSKRIVISNSSLSYWAAKITLFRGNKAVIPQPWFKNHPEYMPELICPGFEIAESIWEP
jgi:hypothetical protein